MSELDAYKARSLLLGEMRAARGISRSRMAMELHMTLPAYLAAERGERPIPLSKVDNTIKAKTSEEKQKYVSLLTQD